MYDVELDTLDIVAAVTAIVAGFSVLTTTGWWDYEDEVVVVALLVFVGAKRLYLPTSPKRADASRVARLWFLFFAIAGAGAGVLSLMVLYADPGLEAASSPTHVLRAGGWPLLWAAGSLLIAFAIERTALKR